MTKQRSLRALDWLNFFMADVGTGLGPFLAIYLTATRHWNPASVGVVVAAQSIASVVAQGPAGWTVDWSHHKKWLVVAATAVVALGCIGIVVAPNETAEVVTQILIGAAGAFFAPAIAAISLGIVGKKNLSRRVGRNESFDHTGNVIFALLAGAVGGDDAVGEIGLPGCFVPGSGAADEHAALAGPGRRSPSRWYHNIMALHCESWTGCQLFTGSFRIRCGKMRRACQRWANVKGDVFHSEWNYTISPRTPP